MVKTRSSRRRVSRRLQRVNLGVGQVRWSGSVGRKPLRPSRENVRTRGVGFSDGDVKLTVFLNLCIGLQRLPSVERHDIGVDVNGNNGAGGVGELLGDEHLSTSVLEHEKHKSVPDNALENDDLNHEAAGEVAVHSFKERDAHNEGVGEGGEREEGDGPFERTLFAEEVPEEEDGEDDDFLEGVGGDEAEVHLVRVVGGDEVEGEERDGEESDEAVDAGALIGGEDLPPFDGAVGEDHGDVERDHGGHDMVEI